MNIHRTRNALLLAALLAAALSAPAAAQGGAQPFTDSFNLSGCTFSTTGANTYMVLEPGFFLELEGEDDGEEVVLRITVLDETILIKGYEARIVEEREWKDGELAEVSRNYFAVCVENNSIFYAGEDVDFYEDGEIVGHEGTWLAGTDGARGGLQMPGLPLLGARYYQEIAPGVALDRAEVVSVTAIMDVPAGRFERCLVTRETNELEPGAEEFKTYAPGIGLIQDGPLLLTEYGYE